MAKDWQALYFQLGELVATMPEGLGGTRPITPEMRVWMGRACVLAREVGDLTDHAKIVTACDNLPVEFVRSGYANTIATVLYRCLATAEMNAPASARGAFIPVGHGFDAFSAVSKMLGAATQQVLIVDPYMDEKALTVFAPLAPEGVQVRLLADAKDHKPSLPPAVAMWRGQHQNTRPLEARLAPARSLHDRLMVVDGQDVWTLTQSLNAFAARSPATIARLDPETARLKAAAFADIWDNAQPLKPTSQPFGCAALRAIRPAAIRMACGLGLRPLVATICSSRWAASWVMRSTVGGGGVSFGWFMVGPFCRPIVQALQPPAGLLPPKSVQPGRWPGENLEVAAVGSPQDDGRRGLANLQVLAHLVVHLLELGLEVGNHAGVALGIRCPLIGGIRPGRHWNPRMKLLKPSRKPAAWFHRPPVPMPAS